LKYSGQTLSPRYYRNCIHIFSIYNIPIIVISLVYHRPLHIFQVHDIAISCMCIITFSLHRLQRGILSLGFPELRSWYLYSPSKTVIYCFVSLTQHIIHYHRIAAGFNTFVQVDTMVQIII